MKDFYSRYKNKDLWSIKEVGFDKEIQNIRESQLTIGSGYLSSRGILEEIPDGANPGTYITGIYDRLTSQVAELVNLPNPFYFKFIVKGEKFGAAAMDVIEHERVLNMYDGLLLRHTLYSDSKKRRFDYQSIRFLSMDDKNLGVLQIMLTPLDCDAQIELQTGIDISVFNRGTVTEGNKKHFHIKEMAFEDYADYKVVETLERRFQIIYRSGFYYKIGRNKKTYGANNVLTLTLKKGQSAVFTKIFTIVHSEKTDNLKMLKRQTRVQFRKAFRKKFEDLLARHTQVWHQLWEIADVQIEGTADIQKNLRFNIYHMLICAYPNKGFSSIGARTLSGEGYRGHIFWDAEIFLLPFYAYIFPEVAKNMLLYRYWRLPQAREIARQKGYKGAMFPWESAGTGEDETPGWAKDLDGTVIPIKTNDLEHHISADIAWACCFYTQVSGDIDFMRDFGYEIVFATARFWASRVTKNKKGKYEICDVIGPDEFHLHVNNNAYTNMLARWNLLMGSKLFDYIKTRNKKIYHALKKKLNLTEKEVGHWKQVAPRIPYNIRKDNVIEEFDGFFKKKHIEIINYDENSIPLLPEGVRVQDYNKTQFVKQADVLMLFHLFPDVFNSKIKESNFWFYVNRTLHKSSLSAPMHALVANQVGALGRAYQFFNVALRADISNLHDNTEEGIHAASLGGVWACVVNGFAGVQPREEILSVDPHMPITWRKIRCRIFWKRNLVNLEIKNTEIRIKIVTKRKSRIRVRLFNVNHVLNPNKEYTFRRLKALRQKGSYL